MTRSSVVCRQSDEYPSAKFSLPGLANFEAYYFSMRQKRRTPQEFGRCLQQQRPVKANLMIQTRGLELDPPNQLNDPRIESFGNATKVRAVYVEDSTSSELRRILAKRDTKVSVVEKVEGLDPKLELDPLANPGVLEPWYWCS